TTTNRSATCGRSSPWWPPSASGARSTPSSTPCGSAATSFPPRPWGPTPTPRRPRSAAAASPTCSRSSASWTASPSASSRATAACGPPSNCSPSRRNDPVPPGFGLRTKPEALARAVRRLLLFLPRLEPQPVVNPLVGQPPGPGREAVLGLVVGQAEAVAGAEQLVHRKGRLDEGPAGVAVGRVPADHQERARGTQGHDLVVLPLRDVGLHLPGQVPRVGPVAHAQADAALVEHPHLVARLEGQGVQHLLGAQRMADAADAVLV